MSYIYTVAVGHTVVNFVLFMVPCHSLLIGVPHQCFL